MKYYRTAARAKYQEENRELLRQKVAAWRKKNKEKAAAYGKQYYQDNKELFTEWRRDWIEKNRAYVNAKNSHYRTIRNVVHPENDPIIEKALYEKALELQQKTGLPYNVDHIIPLSHGGWHHHANLQVLPKHVNNQKYNNPFWEEPGYLSWKDVPKTLWPENLKTEYIKRFYFDIWKK